jgi:hypothetical protein
MSLLKPNPRGRRAALVPPWLCKLAGGLFALAACALSLPLAAEEAVSKEYQLKAAFLYNFAKYVEWPAHSFADAQSPIVIGVLGSNPFGGELTKAVSGRTINGRAIMVVYVHSPAAARRTQVLFVSAAEDSSLADLLAVLKGCAVLTVGESDAFAAQGGIIKFARMNDSLRFAINRDAARQAGLKISAQLQKLGDHP